MLNKKAENMTSFIVMDILEKAKQMEEEGHHIVHLEIGEPDFDAPPKALEAAINALNNQDTHYTHSLGKLELRQEIAKFYLDQYNVIVDEDQIIVTSGTSPAMVMAFAAIMNEEDEVIIPNPYYCCYPNFINIFNGTVKAIDVKEETGFRYNIKDLEDAITPNTEAIIINSPANPTGAVYSSDDFEAIANLNKLIISDEIYNGIIYDGEDHTILEYTDNAIVLNGFSKLYAMTGFRLGYMIVPKHLVRTIQKLQQNFFICASSFGQDAAIAALQSRNEYVPNTIKIYNERRQYLITRLKEMGIAPMCEPQGAFYILANVKKYTNDSLSFCYKIMEEAHIAVSPGSEFGSNAEGYIRISYANSLENIILAMDRLEKFLKTL